MKYYWFKNCQSCPRCEQGRLFVARNRASNQLYLECEECMCGWLDPERVGSQDTYVDFAQGEFDSDCPTLEEIKVAGWEKYSLNETHDND